MRASMKEMAAALNVCGWTRRAIARLCCDAAVRAENATVAVFDERAAKKHVATTSVPTRHHISSGLSGLLFASKSYGSP